MVSQLESNAENTHVSSADGGSLQEGQKRAFDNRESPYATYYTSLEGVPASLGNTDPVASLVRLCSIALVAIAIFTFCAVATFRYAAHLFAAKPEQIDAVVAEMANLRVRLEAVEGSSNAQREAQGNEDPREGKNDDLRIQSFDTSVAKLTDEFDQLRDETSARDVDIASRLDKLEKSVAAAVAMIATPTPTPTPTPLPQPESVSRQADPRVANEGPSAIELSRKLLRGFTIGNIRDGVAVVNGPEGLGAFSQGDVIPGAGVVQKVERLGRDWIVVTSLGTIKTTAKRHPKSAGGAAPKAP